jgi:asparagine synthetase B (glutamine-hydrolysing)
LKASAKAVVRNRYEALRNLAPTSIMDAVTLLDLLGDIFMTQGIWSKLGEAQGLVFHFPFCSRRVADVALAINWETKLCEPKGILRGVARHLGVPEFIITRPKAAFGLDPRHWSRAGGLFSPFLRMASGVIADNDIADANSGEYHDAMTLWNIANYAMWKRLCIRGESLTSLKEELSEAMTTT